MSKLLITPDVPYSTKTSVLHPCVIVYDLTDNLAIMLAGMQMQYLYQEEMWMPVEYNRDYSKDWPLLS